MFILAKVDNISAICQIVAHPTLSQIDGLRRIDNSHIDSDKAEIIIDNNRIPYDTFVKYMRKFRVDTQGRLTFISGTNAANLATNGKLGTLDMSVPMSFTRANTIVNFGRL